MLFRIWLTALIGGTLTYLSSTNQGFKGLVPQQLQQYADHTPAIIGILTSFLIAMMATFCDCSEKKKDDRRLPPRPY